jgi:hypothetical protein
MLSVPRQQRSDKRNKQTAASSDEKQLASGKARRAVKVAVKKEEEYPVKEEEEIEDDPHQDQDEPEHSLKPPAAVNIEERQDGEGDYQWDRDELEDWKQTPAAVKEEEKDETEENEDGKDVLRHSKDEPEDWKKPLVAVKKEEEDKNLGDTFDRVKKSCTPARRSPHPDPSMQFVNSKIAHFEDKANQMTTTTEDLVVLSSDSFSVYRPSQCCSEGPSTIEILSKKAHASKKSGCQIRKKTKTTDCLFHSEFPR